MKKMYEELEVWQLSMDLTVAIYQVTKDFPQTEKYGLVSQMQRAASSIPANIAEGSERKNRKEYTQFLYISRGSLGELVTFLELSNRLGYLNENNYESLKNTMSRVGQMLTRLIQALRK